MAGIAERPWTVSGPPIPRVDAGAAFGARRPEIIEWVGPRKERPAAPAAAAPTHSQAKWAKALLASAMRWTFSRVWMAAPSFL